MDKVIKYYKLLFTLPKERTILPIWIATLIPLLTDPPKLVLSAVQQLYFMLLYYERRVLNARRLMFLFVVGNIMMLVKPEMVVAIYGMTALLSNPHPLTPLIATIPTLMYSPKSVLVLIPPSLAAAYGSIHGITELGIAWLRSWMGDEYEKLERIISEQGVRRRARFVGFGPLSFTDVHFGLMRYSMGTIIPHLMMLGGVIPHRMCGSHENNPANRWESYKILDKVKVNGDEGEFRLTELKGEVEAKKLEGVGCVNVIYHPQGADDLPCLYGECELGDPHNNEGDNPTPQQLERELRTLVVVKERECKVSRVCSAKINGQGLCTNEGKMIEIKCNGEVLKWLIVPGNNMENGNRDEIVKEKGLYEVSTLDDHTCAGFGKNKYQVSKISDFEVYDCREVPSVLWKDEVEYLAMGNSIYEEEVQRIIVRSIKAGIVGAFSSLLLASII